MGVLQCVLSVAGGMGVECVEAVEVEVVNGAEGVPCVN